MFYVGQKVVALISGSFGDTHRIVKGNIYCVKTIKKAICSCSPLLVDIGFRSPATYECCNRCNTTIKATDDIHWLSSNLFAPVDELTKEEEEHMTELIEEAVEEPLKV